MNKKRLVLLLVIVAFAAIGSYQLMAGGTGDVATDAGCGAEAASACDGCTMKCPGMAAAEASAEQPADQPVEKVAETE